jgi:DNA-binding NtrC family response regulator
MIAVLDADIKGCREVCDILESNHYATTCVDSLAELKDKIEQGGFLSVIIDIDSVSVDNRMIRDLALKYPAVRFLCKSKDRFHPELKDAICYHIYACLTKPVDPDELLFWIKSIYDEETMSDTSNTD